MSISVSENMLFYAFHYALGRRTYAVSDVVEELVKNWDCLLEGTRSMVRHEIMDAIEKNQAGDDCDVQEWRRILELAK